MKPLYERHENIDADAEFIGSDLGADFYFSEAVEKLFFKRKITPPRSITLYGSELKEFRLSETSGDSEYDTLYNAGLSLLKEFKNDPSISPNSK